MARHFPMAVPADLCTRLEAARLDLLALFSALDRMDLAPSEIPQRLIRQLFELDAAIACYRQKRTTWSQVAIPKTVKHPQRL